MHFHHNGTRTAWAGVLLWSATAGLGLLRAHGYPIQTRWILGGMVAGLVCILGGLFWEARTEHCPVPESALATLHWYARFCPLAEALLRQNPHPTWGGVCGGKGVSPRPTE